MVSFIIVFCVVVDIMPYSQYIKRRPFGQSQSHCKMRRKTGTSGTSGWMGVEFVFAGLVTE